MYYLTSCSIVKNEDNYIDDFVKIHKFLGVEFFLFFDRSDNPLSERFKGCSDIQVIHYPEPHRHAQAWAEGVQHFKGKARWVQFVDIDQVVVPMKTDDIKIMLQDYEHAAALGLNWHTFGGNNQLNEPSKGTSTYEYYTKRAVNAEPINNHIQSIVQVEHCTPGTWANPHFPPLNPGAVQTNEQHQTFSGPFNIPPSQDVGFIAHYYTRSKEYWSNKLAKLRADTGTSFGSMQDWDHYQAILNKEDDLTVKNIWDRCKK
jgi:hypothetical protein